MAATNPRVIRLDAANQSLGRLASTVARYLRGKHLVTFRPNALPLVQVMVANIGKLRITPRQAAQPVRHFSGYPGGLKTTTLGAAFARSPRWVFTRAVRRMLPDNKLRQRYLRFLHIDL